MGFLSERDVSSAAPIGKRPKCFTCQLYQSCESPKLPVRGSGRSKVLIVDAFPSLTDDAAGRWLTSKGSKWFRQLAEDVCDINLARECWVTGALICHPKTKNPDSKHFPYCLPNLRSVIEELRPDVIVPLGPIALRSVLRGQWKEGVGSIEKWEGFAIPHRKFNAWVCPIRHPDAALQFSAYERAFPNTYARHIEQIFSLQGKPYETIPDYQKQVDVIYDGAEAASILRKMQQRGGACAFDYETNMLKPDSQESKILCCSVSWRGKKTIAYPLAGEAFEATRDFLDSDVPKIGANLQFENRWTLRHFGIPVRNWIWDCVHAAHVLDNRPEITGVKFQAFVRLGQPQYSQYLEAAMTSAKTGNELNQLAQSDQRELLLYCGLDALVEYNVALHQMKEMKVELGDLL